MADFVEAWRKRKQAIAAVAFQEIRLHRPMSGKAQGRTLSECPPTTEFPEKTAFLDCPTVRRSD